MDDVSWGALTLSLTLLGGLYTWWAARQRGAAAAVRGAGVTLLPVALLLTHTLRMVTQIVNAVGDWAGNLVFSPAVWVGVVLGGLGLTLFVVGGMMRDRQLGVGASTSPGAVPAAGGDRRTRAVPVSGVAGLPRGRTKSHGDSGGSEDDEIEALLRKHGIS